MDTSSSTTTAITKSNILLETERVQFLTCTHAMADINLRQITNAFTDVVGIGIWKHMPARYRDLETRKVAAYRRRWGAYISTTTNDSLLNSNLENYIPNIVQFFLTILDQMDNIIMKKNTKQEGEKEEEEYKETVAADYEMKESQNSENDNNDTKPQNKVTQNDVLLHPATFRFIHAALQLFIDLLSTTSTRRYLRPYLLSINFTVKCTLSSFHSLFYASNDNLIAHNDQQCSPILKEKARLFVKQINMLRDLETFGVVDLTAAPLSTSQMASMYHERAHTLQKLVHRHHSSVFTDLVHLGVSMVCNPTFLGKHLNNVKDIEVLIDIAHRLRLVDRDRDDVLAMRSSSNDGEQSLRTFLIRVLLYHHSLRPSELQVLSRLPLYPDEKLLWDEHRVPPGNRMLLGNKGNSDNMTALALPKLNLQFLTYGDYLLRSFKLIRLESAYSIRGDIVDAIKRMRPAIRQYYHDDQYDDGENDVDSISKTEFHGWARMALELHRSNRSFRGGRKKKHWDEDCPPVKIVKVSPPKLGEHIPSQVLADVTLNLKDCGDEIQKEWDGIGEFDNLFLVAVDATIMTGEAAPLLRDIIPGFESFGDKLKLNKRIPDEEDSTFPERYGVRAVRGCMVLEVRDCEGTLLSDRTSSFQDEPSKTPKNNIRKLRVALDPAQYAADAMNTSGSAYSNLNVYNLLNVIVRRHGRENNFKAVLETIRGLMQGTGSINRSIPPWLRPVLLGFGDPTSASYQSQNMKTFTSSTTGLNFLESALDFGDSFLDEDHLRKSFSSCKNVIIDGKDKIVQSDLRRKGYRMKMLNNSAVVSSYDFSSNVKGNSIRFTPVQVKAIQSGLSPGLTLVVGPPGTGKTDVAVQIIANLYHSFPTQRTVIVTHSNAALNDLFEKVVSRGDVDERYMLRLGAGEGDLQIDSAHDFTKIGRVEYISARRISLLEEVQQLSESLGISSALERGPDGSPSYTCETADYFETHYVKKQIHNFLSKLENAADNSNEMIVANTFPFKKYFNIDSSSTLTISDAKKKIDKISSLFSELKEYRPLELLRSQRQRADYLLTKQARIVAMTCTHAAIVRSQLIELGFQYDNILIEEAGQMLDIETFTPLLLQKGDTDNGTFSSARLKRVCLIGDHHQLPPVVKNASFSQYSNLDQSLFARLIRLGVPTIDLNKQGRARTEIASLYNWRYKDLGNLEHVYTLPAFKKSNTGFIHTFQAINVQDYEGKGETTPSAYFYQNLGEAEYAVALFQYMVLIGYPPEKISILTTYNGQKELLQDIICQRCGPGTPLHGIRPGSVSTVDHYQGQQNDFVILSLVRTKAVGHLRDIRRLVVAVSRARLGLYVLYRKSNFDTCNDLRNTMEKFREKPEKLELVIGEHFPTEREATDHDVSKIRKFIVDDVSIMGNLVHEMQQKI